MKELNRMPMAFNNTLPGEMIAYDDHFEFDAIENGETKRYQFEYIKLLSVQCEGNMLKLKYGDKLLLFYTENAQKAQEYKKCLNSSFRKYLIHGDNSAKQPVAPVNTGQNNHVEIVCPKCGSNQVVKAKPLSGKSEIILGIVGFAIVMLFRPSEVMFAIACVVLLIDIIGGIVITVLGKSKAKKNKQQGKWEIRCKTCKNSFVINEPKGEYIITNLQSE
ncbi:MAG: hypothetical protein IJ851_07290 [Eubacterium sp.]|nr:hypothetical protein [Eubacterium sp.]